MFGIYWRYWLLFHIIKLLFLFLDWYAVRISFEQHFVKYMFRIHVRIYRMQQDVAHVLNENIGIDFIGIFCRI